jgi:hypothetical protein
MGGFELDVNPPGGNTPGGSRVLPFRRSELKAEPQLLVHFTVATDDPSVRMDVQRKLADALRPMRTVQGHQIVPVITTEDVKMDYATLQQLAAQIIPAVKSALGIRS